MLPIQKQKAFRFLHFTRTEVINYHFNAFLIENYAEGPSFCSRCLVISLFLLIHERYVTNKLWYSDFDYTSSFIKWYEFSELNKTNGQERAIFYLWKKKMPLVGTWNGAPVLMILCIPAAFQIKLETHNFSDELCDRRWIVTVLNARIPNIKLCSHHSAHKVDHLLQFIFFDYDVLPFQSVSSSLFIGRL